MPWFDEYVKRTTDLPFLVTLRERDGAYVADRFLRASDLGDTAENAEWKTVLLDARTGEPAVPHGSIGFRWGDEGMGKWNLELGDVDPALTLLGRHDELVELDLPRFDVGDAGGEVLRRGVPAKRVGGRLVTTVFDLMAAQLGVHREGLPGTWPTGYDDASEPYTPAWQEPITGVDAGRVTRVAREFARNAERSNGRSMIVLGAGTNHWFHSDQIYRAILQLVALCGCQGVNGGGWAHYVGQEKVRPISGWSTLAFALDWNRPPRQQATTPFWFLASDQFRYQRTRADAYATPLGKGVLDGMHVADCNALAARLGWMPSYPTFDRNPLELTREAAEAGMRGARVRRRPAEGGRAPLRRRGPRRARELPARPDALAREPARLVEQGARVLPPARPRRRGRRRAEHRVDSGGAPERRRLARGGADRQVRPVHDDRLPHERLGALLRRRPARRDVVREARPLVAPTCTRSSTRSTRPSRRPWEARTDFDIFARVAERFSELAEKHLGTRTDLVAAPLLHDTPDELAQPLGEVRDWKRGECEPVPGKTMPKLVPVERDYTAVYRKWRALGPLAEQLGSSAKGIPLKPTVEIDELRAANGEVDGRPALTRDVHMCEAILALSGVIERSAGRRGVPGARAADGDASGRHRRGARRRPDHVRRHAGAAAQGARLAGVVGHGVARPPLQPVHDQRRARRPVQDAHRAPAALRRARVDARVRRGAARRTARRSTSSAWWASSSPATPTRKELHLRWLSPHSKWSIHSEFQDNLHMLTLFRGGPVVWMSDVDANEIEVADNDWVEVFNRNGVVTARAVVSHRIPPGVGLMYHSQDRHVNVPRSELSGTRGGTDNSVTRISMKPTHLIGGYAQLSYGFNYYGPTGTQRDEMVAVRKLLGEVVY